MGLDMTLTKRVYVPPIKDKIKIDIPVIDIDKLLYLEEEAIYWRKVNAIHNWFVKNVQEGEDDCREYYVPIKALKNLLAVVTKVLAYKNKASSILPTQGGFFFGETDYDEYYFEQMKRTKEELKLLLKKHKEFPEFHYYYQASW